MEKILEGSSVKASFNEISILIEFKFMTLLRNCYADIGHKNIRWCDSWDDQIIHTQIRNEGHFWMGTIDSFNRNELKEILIVGKIFQGWGKTNSPWNYGIFNNGYSN